MQDRFDTTASIIRPSNSSAIASPYLNFDPAILKPSGSSQFIIPEGQGETRGKMEMAFFTIGSSVSIGGLFGASNGLLRGIKETKTLASKIRNTQIVNFVGKRGSASAQTFGALALIYSLYDTILTNARGVDDELNSVGAGFLTGCSYMSPHGLRSMVKGGSIGLAFTLAYLGFSKRDLLFSMAENKNKNA